MFRICISHCDRRNISRIFDSIKRYENNCDIEILIQINPEYELQYFVRNQDIDIYIMDPTYTYGNYDGFFIAERIKTIKHHTKIIFVSEEVNIEELLRIVNIEPFGYIFFSNLRTELFKFLDKALAIKNRETCIFTYIKRSEKHQIPLKDVVYFSSSHRTIEYICIDGKRDVFYDKMDNIENVVSQLTNNYIRINQSYLVNQRYIISINGNEIAMINGDILIISRKYHEKLLSVKPNFVSYIKGAEK